MSQPSSCPERKAHGDEPDHRARPPRKRRVALGTIIALNAGATLIAWLAISLLWRAVQALLPGS
jgi:hypothetical protein